MKDQRIETVLIEKQNQKGKIEKTALLKIEVQKHGKPETLILQDRPPNGLRYLRVGGRG